MLLKKSGGYHLRFNWLLLKPNQILEQGQKLLGNFFLGIIPTGRISSAYGYAQALNGTWDWYKKRYRQTEVLVEQIFRTRVILLAGMYHKQIKNLKYQNQMFTDNT